MNENFIKVTWETDKDGNPPTGFAVLAELFAAALAREADKKSEA